MMEGSPKSPCRLQKPFRKFGRGLQKLKNRINEKVDDFRRDRLGSCEYVQLHDEDSVSAAPSTNLEYNGYPVPAPPTNSHNGFGQFPVPAPPTNSYNYCLGEFPVCAPPTNSHNYGLGEFPVPAPPTFSHNGFGQFPVPAPPTMSHNGYGEFPMAGDWWPPAGQNDHEASGSNHASHQNSDYIDTENFDVPAYLRDHQISNFEALWTRPTLSDQVAGLLDGLTVSTPTAGQAPSVFLNMDEFFDTVSTEQPSELFSPGALSVEQLQQELLDSPGPISTEQSWQTAATAWDTPGSSSVYHGSLMTGNTVASQESLLDTGASDYILPPIPEERRGSPGYVRQPVPEERPSSNSEYILQPVPERRPSWIKRPFYSYYTENRRIVRGETGPGRSSGRRGRGFRVLARIACIAIRRRKVRNPCRFLRKRSLNTCYYQGSPTTGSGGYELCSATAPLQQTSFRVSLKTRCTKKLRSEAQPKKKQCDKYSRYKGVQPRNAKWKVEIRVSMTKKGKVWITYDTEEKAALAYDAVMYHCSQKRKMYNFPNLSSPVNLGPSHYDVVLEHCKNGRIEDAKQLVKELANFHAENYAAAAAADAASTSRTLPSCF